MVGFEMFCERCGKRYGNGEATASGSLPLSKRLLKAVGVSSTAPAPPADEPVLRFCLACRGYSCPECWNEDAGFCQTCVPVEEPIAEMPALELPAPLQTPQPLISFEDTEMPPYLQMLADQDEPVPTVDPLADFVVEAGLEVAESEHHPETAEVPALEPLLAFEAEPVAVDEHQAVGGDAMAVQPEVADEVGIDVAREPEVEPVAAAAVEADVVIIDVVEVAAAAVAAEAPAETLALDERPIELVFADEEVVEEGEPEVTWDWDFVAETEAAPVEMPEAVVEPLAAATDAEPSEAGILVDAPVVPPMPEVLPPPVYRPLPPLGPILPPPPPPAAANATPHIEFDLLEPPPAFVIAPQQGQPLMRPTLPAGLFDGPAPQIRPCPQCELPVSAKARFCRRCGSAQS